MSVEKPWYCNQELMSKRLRESDPNLINDLFLCFRKELSTYLQRKCENSQDSDDALQDAFEAVSKNLSQYRGDAPLAHWLFKIASNSCLKQRRGKKNQRQHHQEYDENEMGGDGSSLDIPELIDLEKMLYSLENNERTLLFLKVGQGYSNEEIAKELEITVAAVKSRWNRLEKKILTLVK